MEKEKLVCQHCGCEDGFECVDPYAEDVYQEIIEVVLCQECYNKEVEEI